MDILILLSIVVITVVLVGLKLFDVITWSWWFVFAPVIIASVIGSGLLIAVILALKHFT